MFVDAVEGTDYRLNASRDIDYMTASLQNYNARDVIGLIIFANPFTKKCLKLLRRFDELFVFNHLPIIVINDDVQTLYSSGYLKVQNSKLFLVTSEENSISDVELNAIFTTLVSFSGFMYDLSVCPPELKKVNTSESLDNQKLTLSSELSELLKLVEGGALYEDSSGKGYQ